MIQKQTVKNIIAAFRDSCLSRYPDDTDPLPSEERQKRLGKATDNPLLAALLHDLVSEPLDALSDILASPRLLKLVLRRTDHAWDSLHGEIDFDDLLVVHALQYASKETYAFLLNHLTEIRNLEAGDRGTGNSDRRGLLRKRWEEEVGEADPGSGDQLVSFLFPWWKREGHGDRKEIPQGVRHSSPTDYWLRLQLEGLSESELSDQTILRVGQRWVADHQGQVHDGQTLPQLLYGSAEIGAKVEHFSHLLAGDEIRILAGALFALILTRHGNRSHRDVCASFFNLWRLSLRRYWEGHEAWTAEEACRALPVSLRFANDIYYFWRHRSDNEVETKPPHPELRTAIIEEARRLWQRDISVLIQSLDPSFPYSLFHFAVHYSTPEMGGDGFVASDWRWFGQLVFQAAQRAPETVLPQMSPFLVYQPDSLETRYELRSESGQELFGARFPQLMRLLAEHLSNEGFEPQVKTRMDFLRHAAAKWLSQQEHSEDMQDPQE